MHLAELDAFTPFHHLAGMRLICTWLSSNASGVAIGMALAQSVGCLCWMFEMKCLDICWMDCHKIWQLAMIFGN